MDSLIILDVPTLEPAQKHPTVFRTFDTLREGAAFILQNDHDPIPLFFEMKAERGDSFTWENLENGPENWKVKITKSKSTNPASKEVSNDVIENNNENNLFVLNVTLLQPKEKHPTIFKHFDSLNPGEAFYILNDHDPKPLYYQMLAIRGNVFKWKYVEQGPVKWKILIQKNDVNEGPTLGEIAAGDLRKAEVLKKYNLDFCCGGKKHLKQACDEKNIDYLSVEKELQEVGQTETRKAAFDFNRWGIDFLADYIYNEHHRYWYDEEPVITELVKKVAGHHGLAHPELQKLASLYTTLKQELHTHFIKEERILFPHIKELVSAKNARRFAMPTGVTDINEPVEMMQADHEAAGGILAEIRKATNDFTPPVDACNSFRLLYYKLNALEEDLHQHIHLENNILFPKALQLHKELVNMNLL